MNFERVKREEADKVLKLYRSLLGTPYCVWTEEYPSEKEVEFDLSRDALFCMRDDAGNIAGVISIDDDPNVECLTCWSETMVPSAEVSRVGVCQEFQNQGIAGKLLKGVMEELKKRGYKAVHLLVAKDNVKALRSYDKLLLSEERPTAVLVSDDILALSLERICMEANISIPEDLSILSFNNSLFARLTSPQLTSIDINSGQLGMEAATQMISHIENPSLPATKIIVPHQLIERDSCRRI